MSTAFIYNSSYVFDVPTRLPSSFLKQTDNNKSVSVEWFFENKLHACLIARHEKPQNAEKTRVVNTWMDIGFRPPRIIIIQI